MINSRLRRFKLRLNNDLKKRVKSRKQHFLVGFIADSRKDKNSQVMGMTILSFEKLPTYPQVCDRLNSDKHLAIINSVVLSIIPSYFFQGCSLDESGTFKPLQFTVRKFR